MKVLDQESWKKPWLLAETWAIYTIPYLVGELAKG
jgi:hypothetical protein